MLKVYEVTPNHPATMQCISQDFATKQLHDDCSDCATQRSSVQLSVFFPVFSAFASAHCLHTAALFLCPELKVGATRPPWKAKGNATNAINAIQRSLRSPPRQSAGAVPVPPLMCTLANRVFAQVWAAGKRSVTPTLWIVKSSGCKKRNPPEGT